MKLPLVFLAAFALANVSIVSADPVRIDSGLVSGVELDSESGLKVFRGIPFAAPPVGDLRWRPPQPVRGWEGIRYCDTFGAASIQRMGRNATQVQSEDCLYLNVWSTRSGDQSAKLPVMVWIHGGGLNQSWAHKDMYDGAAFGKEGVVLVSFNYRLGTLGFLSHPGLSAESAEGVSGNYGFMD